MVCGLLVPPALAHAQFARSEVLVRYSFDDGQVDTGPDTFRLFQHAKGRVSLSPVYRWSGRYSVEIEDVPGDGDFPELQGYFARRSEGLLYLHFALMTTDAQEELNIALAGSSGFSLAKDGIGFWLQTQGGYLRHVSDSIPKKLFRMRPFVFYLFDVEYDIGRGVYDLRITEEGNRRAVVQLTDQANASSSAASNVQMFSFIGDRGEDRSKVHYFVDDILVSTDREIVQLPFQAPGRRQLFIDAWHEANIAADRAVRCPELERPEDLGVASRDLRLPAEADQGPASDPIELLRAAPDGARVVRAGHAWRTGCRALARGDAASALEAFDRAIAERPTAGLIELSRALALAKLGRWQDAESSLLREAGARPRDPRWPIVAASVSFLRGDLEHAQDALARAMAQPANGASPADASSVARRYLMVLMWNGKPEQAVRVCEEWLANRRAARQPVAQWLELLGDALFYAGRARDAATAYKQSLAGHPDPARLDQKLSDAYFKLGDLAQERRYRERVWGTFHAPSSAAEQAQ